MPQPTSTQTPRTERRSPFSVLRHRNFALYWSGQAVSLTGTWMQALALNWVVVTFTTSAFALGLLNFCGTLPMMLLTLLGGVAADRFDKRKILIITQVVLMLNAFALAALYLAGALRLWHIYALAALNGIASAYDMPANQALTPELVEREEIPQAIALNQSIFHGSRVVGPALAGIVLGYLGTASAFIANGISFVAVIISLLLISYRPRARAERHVSHLASLREGLVYVLERPRLKVLMGLTVLTTTLVFPNHVVLLPLYIKEVLGMGARELGLVMSIGGGGALVGSLLLLTVARERRQARITLGSAGVALGLLALAFARGLAVPSAAVFVISLSISLSMGLVATITQEVVPNVLRGRVMSLNGMMFVGVLPISALLISGTAQLLGLRGELMLSGALFAVGCTWLLRIYARSEELPVAEEPPAA